MVMTSFFLITLPEELSTLFVLGFIDFCIKFKSFWIKVFKLSTKSSALRLKQISNSRDDVIFDINPF